MHRLMIVLGVLLVSPWHTALALDLCTQRGSGQNVGAPDACKSPESPRVGPATPPPVIRFNPNIQLQPPPPEVPPLIARPDQRR
jgi:hypothetical protein